MLIDSNSSFTDIDGEKDIPYRAPGESRVEREHISAWRVGYEVHTGEYVHDDYDFTKPRVDLEGKRPRCGSIRMPNLRNTIIQVCIPKHLTVSRWPAFESTKSRVSIDAMPELATTWFGAGQTIQSDRIPAR